jgi:hypothetical protein
VADNSTLPWVLPVTLGAPVKPGGASLTVTGGTPVVTVGINVVPSGATLTVSGGTPTVSTPRLVVPTGASLTVTGGTPVVTVGISVTPAGATLTVTGGTPSITLPVLVTPSGANLTVTGSAPVVSVLVTVAPTGAALAITGGTPTIVRPILVRPNRTTIAITGHRPRITGATVAAPVEPIPTWAASVSAFSSSASSSHMVPGGGQLQFPDTSQFGGLCGQLLGGNAFTGGLVDSGDPTQGPAGALVGGTQGFTDQFCGLMGGTGVDTTPQSVIGGATDVHSAIHANPMASGTIAMGQPDGPTGNTALDAINGGQTFANELFNIFSACGCGGANSPDNVTPQQVIDTTQQTADGVQNSPMAMGIIGMGQDPTGSGNIAVDALNGGQFFANTLFSIFRACGCGGTNSPDQATPQTVIDTTQQTADAVSANPMAMGIIGMGQADGGSGNVAVDALNGGQFFANSLFSILQLCGCVPESDSLTLASGPLQMGVPINPYAPANVTPDIVISAVQAVSDAVAANPIAANIIAQGLPGAGGNLGVAAVSGATAAVAAFQNDVSAASTLGQTNAESISLQAINNSNYHAVDRTLNAVFNISSLTGSSPDTVTITEDASEIGFVTIPTSTTKTFGVFVGRKTGTLTGVYVNVYSVNSATQTLTLVSSSLNQTTDVTGSLQWIYAELQSDVVVTQGQCYAVELAVQGSGSLTIVGMPNHWLIANTNTGVYPAKLAAMRSTSVFDSSVAWAGTGSVTSGSLTHVIGALATAVFLCVNAVGGGGTPTASVGGNAMTLLQTFSYSGGKLYVWVLYSPPTGSQTVAFTGLTSSLVSAASVAFNGVTAAGTPVTASGTGTALSQTATGTAGGLLLQMFGYSAGVGTITGYSQTLAASEPGSSGNDDPLAVGYAAATGSSQTFTATGSVSDPWGAVAIPLTATIPTVTAPSSMVAPTYSPNVPWLALSSVIPAPLVLTPATAPMTLTLGSPEVIYPGSPTLFMLVDTSSATSHTLANSYGLFDFTGASPAVWTLPPIAANNGLMIFLYNRGSATVTVTCAGADYIYQASGITTSVSLPSNGSLTLVNDGVYWLSV